MLGITNVSNAPSIVLKDTVVSTWTSGSYNGYSYRGTIPITGVTADTIAEVTFSQAQAESGNYSSVCTTYDGGLYVYSKVNTQITIPSIIIHSIVETYYEMDNSPVSGSTKAVTSGGVYSALNTITSFEPTRVDCTGGSLYGWKVGHIVIIQIYNVGPNRGGDITICSQPYTPKNRVLTLGFENNNKGARPLYTSSGGSNKNIGMYIVGGDTAMFGQIIFVTDD